MQIREATLDDVTASARVHVDSWRQPMRGSFRRSLWLVWVIRSARRDFLKVWPIPLIRLDSARSPRWPI